MTQLICLVQRLNLGDQNHTLIRENEIFEVDEATAETYIKGGIAKPVSAPEPVPEPVKSREEPKPVEVEQPPSQPQAPPKRRR